MSRITSSLIASAVSLCFATPAFATHFLVGIDPLTGKSSLVVLNGVVQGGALPRDNSTPAYPSPQIITPTQQITTSPQPPSAPGVQAVDLDQFTSNASAAIIEAILANKNAIEQENQALTGSKLDNLLGNVVAKTTEQTNKPDRPGSPIDNLGGAPQQEVEAKLGRVLSQLQTDLQRQELIKQVTGAAGGASQTGPENLDPRAPADHALAASVLAEAASKRLIQQSSPIMQAIANLNNANGAPPSVGQGREQPGQMTEEQQQMLDTYRQAVDSTLNQILMNALAAGAASPEEVKRIIEAANAQINTEGRAYDLNKEVPVIDQTAGVDPKMQAEREAQRQQLEQRKQEQQAKKEEQRKEVQQSNNNLIQQIQNAQQAQQQQNQQAAEDAKKRAMDQVMGSPTAEQQKALQERIAQREQERASVPSVPPSNNQAPELPSVSYRSPSELAQNIQQAGAAQIEQMQEQKRKFEEEIKRELGNAPGNVGALPPAGSLSPSDEEAYRQKVDSALQDLLGNAVQSGTLTQAELESIIAQANAQSPQHTNDLKKELPVIDRTAGVDPKMQAEREAQRQQAEQRKQEQQAQKEEKRQEVANNNASLIAQIQAAAAELQERNRQAQQEKAKQAQEQYQASLTAEQRKLLEQREQRQREQSAPETAARPTLPASPTPPSPPASPVAAPGSLSAPEGSESADGSALMAAMVKIRAMLDEAGYQLGEQSGNPGAASDLSQVLMQEMSKVAAMYNELTQSASSLPAQGLDFTAERTMLTALMKEIMTTVNEQNQLVLRQLDEAIQVAVAKVVESQRPEEDIPDVETPEERPDPWASYIYVANNQLTGRVPEHSLYGEVFAHYDGRVGGTVGEEVVNGTIRMTIDLGNNPYGDNVWGVMHFGDDALELSGSLNSNGNLSGGLYGFAFGGYLKEESEGGNKFSGFDGSLFGPQAEQIGGKWWVTVDGGSNEVTGGGRFAGAQTGLDH